jgi:transcriptional regulator with XRE-family HTH domain
VQLVTISVVRDELQAALGRRIRQLRRQERISQEELAARADLHRNYIGSIERGERDVGVSSLARIAFALGISLAELMKPFDSVDRIRSNRRRPKREL